MMDWNMGGYGGYIWPAYGVTALGLGAAILLTWRGWRQAKKKLAELERP